METLKTRERDELDDNHIARGQRVGRYLVLGEIGKGGMGIVYRAYDPELNRKVALKVLRTAERDGSRLAVARVRLQREAQTLARLSHRNVVSVYDVGTRGDDVFLAMELCEGQDLQSWLALRPRRTAEVLAALLLAGEGLAAAHDVGIVHRDFKPSNVLVGDDGRICVTDFGLARPETTLERPAARRTSASTIATLDPSESAVGDGGLFDLTLTEAGRAVGTPAYMAPEQHAGEPADPRCDQYAFCITLWEALYGKRPFVGASSRLLAEHKRLGLEAAPPRRGVAGAVPWRVRRALVRGLSIDPARRFPRLADLLAQLRPAPARARRLASVALMATAGVLVLAAAPLRERPESPCSGSGDRLGEAWNDDAREAVTAALTTHAAPYAAATAETVVQMLDRRGMAWAQMHEDACEATWERGEQSAQLLDLRMACLEDHRRHLAATVRVLADADRAVVDRAAAMVVALPEVSACADVARLQGAPRPPDAETADRVSAARDAIADVVASRRAGLHREALARIERLDADTAALRHPATRSEIEVLHARLVDDDGRFPEAIERLEHAAIVARAAGHARVETEAWTELARIVGGRMQKAERGRFYAELALATAARLPDPDGLRAAALLELGEVEFRSGHDELAAAHIGDALKLRETELGRDHYLVAEALGRLAGTDFRRGDHDEAIAALERAIEIYAGVFGPAHPRVAAPMGNLGLVLAATGRTDAALSQMSRAKEILQAAFGPGHPGVAGADDSIGHVLGTVGRHEEALVHYHAAIATFERSLGGDHPALAAPLLGSGLSLLGLGDPASARAPIERARQVATHGELPPVELADIDFALARALHPAGDSARAVELARAARATFIEELHPTDDRVGAVDEWLREHAGTL